MQNIVNLNLAAAIETLRGKVFASSSTISNGCNYATLHTVPVPFLSQVPPSSRVVVLDLFLTFEFSINGVSVCLRSGDASSYSTVAKGARFSEFRYAHEYGLEMLKEVQANSTDLVRHVMLLQGGLIPAGTHTLADFLPTSNIVDLMHRYEVTFTRELDGVVDQFQRKVWARSEFTATMVARASVLDQLGTREHLFLLEVVKCATRRVELGEASCVDEEDE